MLAEPAPLTLHTERLSLTLPAPADAEKMVDYFADNREHLAPWEPPFPRGLFTRPFWERRLHQNRQEFLANRSLRLVLFDRRDPSGPVIGMANFTQFVRGAFMACTLGYSLARDAEGKGYMTEALQAAIRYVFDELSMHRIMANYLPTNERSGRLLRRLGFRVEGYARAYIFIDGAWRDHILTALINDAIERPDYLIAP